VDAYFKSVVTALERIEMKLDCIVAADGHPDLPRWFTHVNINHTLPPEIVASQPKPRNAKAPTRPDLFVEPHNVRHDDEGRNQWGSKYTSQCSNCGSAYSTNMYGMGQCQACGTNHNPLAKS
jgi:hypothetical protein